MGAFIFTLVAYVLAFAKCEDTYLPWSLSGVFSACGGIAALVFAFSGLAEEVCNNMLAFSMVSLVVNVITGISIRHSGSSRLKVEPREWCNSFILCVVALLCVVGAIIIRSH